MKEIPKRNGDWCITRTTEKITGKKLEHNGSFIFATGEATNHHHAINVTDPKDMQIVKLPNGDYILQLKSEAVVTHPEHSLKKDLILKPGKYRLNQKRETDYFSMMTRKIID